MNTLENKQFTPSFESKSVLNKRNKYNTKTGYEYLDFYKHELVLSVLSPKTNNFVMKALYLIRLRLWNIALNQRA